MSSEPPPVTASAERHDLLAPGSSGSAPRTSRKAASLSVPSAVDATFGTYTTAGPIARPAIEVRGAGAGIAVAATDRLALFTDDDASLSPGFAAVQTVSAGVRVRFWKSAPRPARIIVGRRS